MFRFIYSHQHLAASNTKVPLTYLGPSGRFGSNGGRPFVTASDGFRLYYSNFSEPRTRRSIWLNLRNLGIVFKKRVIIGFRYYSYGTAHLFHIGQFAQYYGDTYSGFSVSYAESGNIQSGYAEVVIDFDARTYTLFINGVSRKVQPMFGYDPDYFESQADLMLATDAPGSNSSADILGVAFTDYYVRDSEGEAAPILPMSNVTPHLITSNDISGVLVNPTTAPAAVANINAIAAVDVANPPLAYIDDAAAGAVIATKVGMAAIAGRNPVAVAMFSSAIGPKRPTMTWGVGADVKTIATDPYPLNNGVQSIASLGVSDKAPDGQVWTWDKLNQLSLKMTFP